MVTFIKQFFLSGAAVITLIVALATGCEWESHNDDIRSLLSSSIASNGNFSLAKSQTASSNRLDILYDKTFSGNIIYIVSRTDLNITNLFQFKASTAAKTAKRINADSQIYDDYIALSSLSSGTTYYVYILSYGKVTSLIQTTNPASTSLRETGTIAGYGGDIDYSINFPAGYDAASSTTWPVLLSVKAPNFTSDDPHFPCITFNTDISYSSMTQMNHDIEELRIEFNAFIEDTTYKINKNKIYACGFSAGGCAVMKIANNDGSDQYNITAIAANGISDWLGTNSDWTGNLGDTNIWISCGEDDPWGADIAYRNMPKTSGDHLLSIYPGLGHTSSPTWASPYTFMWLLSK